METKRLFMERKGINYIIAFVVIVAMLFAPMTISQDRVHAGAKYPDAKSLDLGVTTSGSIASTVTDITIPRLDGGTQNVKGVIYEVEFGQDKLYELNVTTESNKQANGMYIDKDGNILDVFSFIGDAQNNIPDYYATETSEHYIVIYRSAFTPADSFSISVDEVSTYVYGTVKGSDGNPIINAQIDVLHGDVIYPEKTVYTNSNGIFYFSSDEGSHKVAVQGHDKYCYEEAVVNVVSGKNNCNIIMQIGGTITGVVKDYKGTLVPGGLEILVYDSSGKAVNHVILPDNESGYSLERIKAGNYRLEIKNTHNPNNYVTQFYNSKYTLATANQVSVSQGMTTSGINFTVFPSSICHATFNSDGGTAVSDMYLNVGSAIGTLPTTSKTGYDFLGWYDNTTKISESTIIGTNHKEFTAKWQKQSSYVKSSDNKLKKLKFSTGKLKPKFKSTQKTYKLTISAKKKSVKITPTKNHKKAKVQYKIGKGKYKTVKKSFTVKVNKGKSKKVTIRVTAENGKKRNYTVTVKRKK